MNKFYMLIGGLVCSISVNAQEWKHSFSFLVNKNFSTYNLNVQQGPLDFKQKHIDYGGDYRLSYYLPNTNKLFISSGIRLNVAQSSVMTINTVPGFLVENSFIHWKFRWWQAYMPLYFGKTIQPFKNSFQLDVYGGFGLGILKGASKYERMTFQKSNNDADVVGIEVQTEGLNFDPFKAKLLTSVDLGFQFTPLSFYPNISLGIFCAYNLQKTNNVMGNGIIGNATQGIYQKYNFAYSNNFTNVTFTLTYSFGKKWKSKMINNKID